MSTVTTIPTLEQSSALARLVHWGELTDEHRYLIAKLLDEIGTSVRVAAETARKYPNDSRAQDLAARPTGEQSAPLPMISLGVVTVAEWAPTRSVGRGPDGVGRHVAWRRTSSPECSAPGRR